MAHALLEGDGASATAARWPGFLAAGTVVLIWSSWLVVSRSGATSALTVYDLAAFRYGVSALVSLPIVLYLKPWRVMALHRILALTFLLGPAYILLVFEGFANAPAAHGGIFMNGLLPVVTLFIGWYWLRQAVGVRQKLGAALILAGTCLSAFAAGEFSFAESWLGDLLFMAGAVFFGTFMVLSRLWKIGMAQIMLCGALINAVLYMPVWLFFLPSGIAETADSQLTLQVLFQGLVPNLIGIILVAFATQRIESDIVSAFMAGVPGLSAVLGVIFLSEVLGFVGWSGVAVLTVGIVAVALKVTGPEPRC